jgi:nitrate reductase NapE
MGIQEAFLPQIEQQPHEAKRREWLAFLGLTFVVAPILAVATVSGYGFAVWIYQIIAGPPTG